MNYITVTGVLNTLTIPVRWHGLSVDAFTGKACNLVNTITHHEWSPHDFNAKDAAEIVTASEYSAQNGGCHQSEELLKKAKVLLNVLDPKPRWRD